MNYKLIKCIVLILATVLWIDTLPSMAAGLIVDHQASANFNQITTDSFAAIRSSSNIFYGHTSHGSQIISGLAMLENENSGLYRRPTIHEAGGIDLGDYNWDGRTRDYLNSHAGINLVIWSWCGQLSWYNDGEVDNYLSRMNQLETDYANVTFAYMTGHLDGSGSSGTLQRNNDRIRSYCTANNKVLFDFADIESYDPAGVHHPNGTDQCEWCADWCRTHDCPGCNGCAHSHCFNCYQKGKAFWSMLVSLLGRSPGSPSSPTSDDDSSTCFIMSLQ